jgi:hypothetical protein
MSEQTLKSVARDLEKMTPTMRVIWLEGALGAARQRMEAAALTIRYPLDVGDALSHNDGTAVDVLIEGAAELLDEIKPVLEWLRAEHKPELFKAAEAKHAAATAAATHKKSTARAAKPRRPKPGKRLKVA